MDIESAKLRHKFEKSLYNTAKYLLGYKDLTTKTHARVCDALEAPTKRKIIVMPRGTFKSSICSVSYPVWTLINNENARILIDSELYTNSKNFIREIKTHLEGGLITQLFGEFKSDKRWAESDIIIKQRTKVLKEASITASGIGTQKTSQHFDLIIMDDMNSDGNSGTQEGRQKVINHYRHNIAILEPGGTLVIVGTRHSANDLIGEVLNTEFESTKEGLL